MKPLSVDIPFPSLAGIVPSRRQAEIISPAYAAPDSELTTILQYVYHHFYFENENMEDIASLYEQIFISEMTHLDHLGNALLKLGADPVFTKRPPIKENFFTAAYVKYSKNPKQMLIDDINSEMHAIAQYRAMLPKLDDAPLAALISRIIMDEELHLKTFKELYSNIANN